MLLLLENRRRKEQDVAAEMRRIHSLLSRPGTLNPKLNPRCAGHTPSSPLWCLNPKP